MFRHLPVLPVALTLGLAAAVAAPHAAVPRDKAGDAPSAHPPLILRTSPAPDPFRLDEVVRRLGDAVRRAFWPAPPTLPPTGQLAVNDTPKSRTQ